MLLQPLKQCLQGNRRGEVPSIGADVNAGEDNFFKSLFFQCSQSAPGSCQAGGFSIDLWHEGRCSKNSGNRIRPGSSGRPVCGDGRNEGGFRKRTVFFLNIGYLDRREIAPLRSGEEDRERRHFSTFPRTCLTPWISATVSGIYLRITSGDDEERFRVGPECPPDHLPRLKIGPVSDGAGIDDGDIRRFSEGTQAIPALFQRSHQGFGFELIDFATQRGNSKRSSWFLRRLMRESHSA